MNTSGNGRKRNLVISRSTFYSATKSYISTYVCMIQRIEKNTRKKILEHFARNSRFVFLD